MRVCVFVAVEESDSWPQIKSQRKLNTHTYIVSKLCFLWNEKLSIPDSRGWSREKKELLIQLLFASQSKITTIKSYLFFSRNQNFSLESNFDVSVAVWNANWMYDSRIILKMKFSRTQIKLIEKTRERNGDDDGSFVFVCHIEMNTPCDCHRYFDVRNMHTQCCVCFAAISLRLHMGCI